MTLVTMPKIFARLNLPLEVANRQLVLKMKLNETDTKIAMTSKGLSIIKK
ncbi:hypothetical protein [Abyssicoccus albus]|nr:hypothetical protein [Abyssicoccus albus]